MQQTHYDNSFNLAERTGFEHLLQMPEMTRLPSKAAQNPAHSAHGTLESTPISRSSSRLGQRLPSPSEIGW